MPPPKRAIENQCERHNSTTTATRVPGISEWKEGTIYIQYNDDEFLDAVDLELISGRDFDRNRKADTAVVMMNMAFVERMGGGSPGDIIGKHLQFKNDDDDDKYEVIGIIENFNRTTLKNTVEPTLYFPWMNPVETVVKFNPANYQDGVAHLESVWGRFFPNTPLDYIFLDERFERLYTQDKRFGRVFVLFSVLAILIASLGLFGLSSFMAIQKTKEVGVRKVLGASITGIVAMFYKDFAKLILVAALISIPVVYYLMNAWLQNYAFRIDFQWLVLVAALLVVSLFALVVVGSQIYKVAVLNPAETLKYE